MKPRALSGTGSASSYGMAWEILRTHQLTRDGHPLDIVSKSGALRSYYSTIALIPELGLGFSILVAGEEKTMHRLRTDITERLLPMVEDGLREATKLKYEGEYIFMEQGVPDQAWRLRLSVDEQHEGLRITEWFSDGKDFLKNYSALQGRVGDSWEAHVIPSNVKFVEGPWMVQVWRVMMVPNAPETGCTVWNCGSWNDIDDLQWAGKSVGEFRIKENGDGQVISIEMVGLRKEVFKMAYSDFKTKSWFEKIAEWLMLISFEL